MNVTAAFYAKSVKGHPFCMYAFEMACSDVHSMCCIWGGEHVN